MKSKALTIEQQLKRYKKQFRLVLTLLIFFLMLTAVYIYLNYDYLAFKHFITSYYIHTDALDRLYEQELKQDANGKYFSYFDDVAIAVMTKSIREINRDRYTYLYTPERLKQYKEEEKDEASLSEIKELNRETIYLRLTNFSKYTEKFVKDHAEQLKKYKNIIIDLQDNYGGDIDVMVRISSMFLPKGSVIATDRMRFFNWTYRAKGQKVFNYDRITILQNGSTASASENMITALKDNLDNVTLIGETTYGKGIGQYTLPLKRGFAVKATILEWYTTKGINIQGKGIQPDIPYTGKDIIEFALTEPGRQD